MNRFHLIITAILFSSLPLHHAWTQNSCFQIENYPDTERIRGCVPFSITINDDCSNGLDNILYDYENSGVRTSEKTYTYHQAGIYSITQFGNIGANGVQFTKTDYIEVLPVSPPSFSVKRCENRNVIVQIHEGNYEKYTLDFGDGTVLEDVNTLQDYQHQYAAAQNYEISVEGQYLIASDIDPNGNNCGRSAVQEVQAFIPIPLPDLQAQSLSIDPCNGQIQLSFQAAADLSYHIYYSGEDDFTLIETLRNTQNALISYTIDHLNTLTRSHQFYLLIQDQCSNETQTAIVTVEAYTDQNLPIPIPNLNSSIENGSTHLSWEHFELENLQKYNLYKNQDFLVQTVENQYLSSGIGYDTYTLAFKDSCDQKIFYSHPTRPVILENKALGLVWTSYINSENEQSLYFLEKINPDNEVYEENPMGAQLSFQDRLEDETYQIIRYRVRYQTDNFTGYSNVISVKQAMKIFFPTAFTPNGDGINDTFFPKGKFIKTYALDILHPSGQTIFSGNQMDQGWDGTINGKSAPAGTYVYTVYVEDYTGQSHQQSGSFALLR